jgi:general secretion pathway protein G
MSAKSWIIIAVTLILAGAGIYYVVNQRTVAVAKIESDAVKQTATSLAAIETTLGDFKDKCGKFPAALADLFVQSSCWQPVDKAALDINDPWQRPFIYEASGEGYRILSLGADGKEGGEGTDRDIFSEQK